MNDADIRLECVRLVMQEQRFTCTASEIVAAASTLFDFVTGRPTKTPRQLIDEALEAEAARLDGLRAGYVAGAHRGGYVVEGGRADQLGARSAAIGSGGFARAPETD